MQVIGDAGAGDLAEVQARVEAVGGHHLSQRPHRPPRKRHQAEQLVLVEVLESSHMAIGSHHDVAARVGICVQERKAASAALEQRLVRVLPGRDRAEQAAPPLRPGDVLGPPRSPQGPPAHGTAGS